MLEHRPKKAETVFSNRQDDKGKSSLATLAELDHIAMQGHSSAQLAACFSSTGSGAQIR